MTNLELRGSAKLRSIETGGFAELILISEPFSLAEIVIGFEKQFTDDGNTIPQISVVMAKFTLSEEVYVGTPDNLPQGKRHKYEEGVKKWLKESVSEREKDFKNNF